MPPFVERLLAGKIIAWIGVSLSIVLMPLSVLAHPLIDAARARFEAADFAGAIEALEAAEAADELSRADVVEIVELRAIVHDALGDETAAEQALRALASLERDHAFPPEAPPELVERFRRTSAEPMELRVTRRQTSAGAVIEAVVLHDPSGLVRHVRVAGRVENEGEWQVAQDQAMLIELDDGEFEEWYAAAVGPGGSVLLSRSSRVGMVPPLALGLRTETHVPDPFADRERTVRPRREGRRGLWIGVGVGAAVVVLAVFIVGFVVGTDQNDEDTEVLGPYVEGF